MLRSRSALEDGGEAESSCAEVVVEVEVLEVVGGESISGEETGVSEVSGVVSKRVKSGRVREEEEEVEG